MENYKLKKPIKFEGKEIKELNFDFDSMNFNEYKLCVRAAKARLGKREYMSTPALNETFQACFAAKAAGVVPEMIFSLGAFDFVQVALLTQNFLLDSDSEEEIAEEWETAMAEKMES